MSYELKGRKTKLKSLYRLIVNIVSFKLRHNKRKRFILSDKLHPQTIACVQTRALPFGITIEVGNIFETDFSKKDISGVLFQYPDTEGNIMDFSKIVDQAHKFGVSRGLNK